MQTRIDGGAERSSILLLFYNEENGKDNFKPGIVTRWVGVRVKEEERDENS